MKKTFNKRSILIQRLIVLFIILCGAGYYYFNFIVNANLREVVPGKVYRSAQPSENQLKKIIKEYGIKTVINLRAKKTKDYEKEKLVTDQFGIKFVRMDLSRSKLVPTSELQRLVEVLETAQTPVLLHCKSGVDRSGFVSALAAMAIGHEDFNVAKWQAYAPPGPQKRKDFSKIRADYLYNYVHISDTLKLYEDFCRQNNRNENDWNQFVQWVNELPPTESHGITYYKPVYSYFPFMGENKHFIPIWKLLKESYLQFSIEILIVILLIYYTKFCLKSMKST